LDKDFVIGGHVTKSFMESKPTNGLGGLVRGRALHSIAKKLMANMKKALAFLTMMPEVDEVSTEGVIYRSGNSEDKIKSKLLDLMYIELNGKADEIKLDDDDDDSYKIIMSLRPLILPMIVTMDRRCHLSRLAPSAGFFQAGFHFVYLGLF
jgi:hypothetical protein